MAGEAGVDALAGGPHALACRAREKVAGGEKHECRAERRRQHGDHGADDAAEQHAACQREHEPAGKAERHRPGVRDEGDGERRGTVRVGEPQQRVAILAQRAERPVVRTVERHERDDAPD